MRFLPHLLIAFFIDFVLSRMLLPVDPVIDSPDSFGSNLADQPLPKKDQALSPFLATLKRGDINVLNKEDSDQHSEQKDIRLNTADAEIGSSCPSRLRDGSDHEVDSPDGEFRPIRRKQIRCENIADLRLCCRNPEGVTRRGTGISNPIEDPLARRPLITQCVSCRC